MSGRECPVCAAPVGPRSKSGMCRRCATRASRADPVREAKRLANLRAKFATPEHRAKQSRIRKQVEIERANDPAWIAYRRNAGLRLRADYDADPQAQAANLAKRSLVGRKNSQRFRAWCPPDKWDDYQTLRDKVGGAEARRLIEAEMTPFERQMVRIASGAQITATFRPSRADPTMTLGGIATGAL